MRHDRLNGDQMSLVYCHQQWTETDVMWVFRLEFDGY